MRYCPQCGEQQLSGARYCVACGTSQPDASPVAVTGSTSPTRDKIAEAFSAPRPTSAPIAIGPGEAASASQMAFPACLFAAEVLAVLHIMPSLSGTGQLEAVVIAGLFVGVMGTALVAHAKGRNPTAWALLGAVFGLAAFLVIAVLPRDV